MSTWIRFRYDNGDAALVNAEETHVFFKADDSRIEVLPLAPQPVEGGQAVPLVVYQCEYPDQVTAAEELIFDALSRGESVTISLDVLEEHAEYLNNVQGIRMILSLIHQGSIRIPKNEELPDKGELFEQEEEGNPSEISRFESMLHTYLDVPDDTLRRAFANGGLDSPFELKKDHEECPDHGFHEYWIVETRPDRNYIFRDSYQELVKSLQENEGYVWSEPRSYQHPS
jgi:hypothetical protein